MRIALRTSGGRGEYELAGSQDGITPSDLYGRRIAVSFVPNLELDTGNIITHISGKPRVRLDNQKVNQHLYLILAELLLLPKPKREISKTSEGSFKFINDCFSVISINFDILYYNSEKIVIFPNTLLLSNKNSQAEIMVSERLGALFAIWNKDNSPHDKFASYIVKLKESFYGCDLFKIHEASKSIKALFSDKGDILTQILIELDIAKYYPPSPGLHMDSNSPELIEDNRYSLQQSNLDRIKKWRMQAVRGPEALAFSKKIKEYYNNTCLFSGDYLPKTNLLSSSGVDAAHILPWVEYNINSLENGICLNKYCHWAFDNGILRLAYDKAKSAYILDIPEIHLLYEAKAEISLKYFKNLCGIIPQSRLPLDRRLWPNPEYLDEYNAIMSNALSI